MNNFGSSWDHSHVHRFHNLRGLISSFGQFYWQFQFLNEPNFDENIAENSHICECLQKACHLISACSLWKAIAYCSNTEKWKNWMMLSDLPELVFTYCWWRKHTIVFYDSSYVTLNPTESRGLLSLAFDKVFLLQLICLGNINEWNKFRFFFSSSFGVVKFSYDQTSSPTIKSKPEELCSHTSLFAYYS